MDIDTKKSIDANYLTNKEFIYLLDKTKRNPFKLFQITSIIELIFFYFILNIFFSINQLEYLGYLTIFSFVGYIFIKFDIFKLSYITKIVDFTDTEFKKVSYMDKTSIGYLLNCRSLFWVLLIVFSFKSFIYENFIIPSESMEPTLKVGDVVYVDKINRDNYKKDDIIVFKSPLIKSNFYIKRIIATPGDQIEVNKNDVVINGKNIKGNLIGDTYQKVINQTTNKEVDLKFNLYNENNHIITEVDSNEDNFKYNFSNKFHSFPINKIFNAFDYCKSNNENELSCLIPNDKYFVMGDNRDNSLDGRFFGLVDKQDISGRATHKNLFKKIN